MNEPKRDLIENTVATLLTKNGKKAVSVVEVSPGVFQARLQVKYYDDDEDLEYWSNHGGITHGSFGSIDIAISETSIQLGEELKRVIE